MAVDSLEKRASILGYVLPDNDIDRGDVQTLAGFYRGILAQEEILLGQLVEMIQLTDAALKNLNSFHSVSDGLSITDSNLVIGSFPVSITEEVTFSDVTDRLVGLLALCSDSISVTTNSTNSMILQVVVEDGVQFQDIVDVIHDLTGIIVDGVSFTDRDREASQIAVGRVTVTMVGRAATISFTAAKPSVTFS
jgi:hypothetical protein